MGLTKYQKAEKVEVVPPKRVEAGLKKVGKTSARDLNDEEREAALGDLKTGSPGLTHRPVK